MNTIKVNLHFSLTGKVDFCNDGLSNSDLLDGVHDVVRRQFGNRPVFFSDANKVTSKGKYPGFYSAGWFVGDTSGVGGSELVVIAHGNSMAEARSNMMNGVEHCDWERDSGVF